MPLPRYMLVDQGGDAEPLGGSRQGGDVAVLERANAQASGRILQEPLEQRIGGSEVEHGDGARLAVDAAGLDDAPVGASVDNVSLQAGHLFCVYNKSETKSIQNVVSMNMLHYSPIAICIQAVCLSVFCVYEKDPLPNEHKPAPAGASETTRKVREVRFLVKSR